MLHWHLMLNPAAPACQTSMSHNKTQDLEYQHKCHQHFLFLSTASTAATSSSSAEREVARLVHNILQTGRQSSHLIMNTSELTMRALRSCMDALRSAPDVPVVLVMDECNTASVQIPRHTANHSHSHGCSPADINAACLSGNTSLPYLTNLGTRHLYPLKHNCELLACLHSLP